MHTKLSIINIFSYHFGNKIELSKIVFNNITKTLNFQYQINYLYLIEF